MFKLMYTYLKISKFHFFIKKLHTPNTQQPSQTYTPSDQDLKTTSLSQCPVPTKITHIFKRKYDFPKIRIVMVQ